MIVSGNRDKEQMLLDKERIAGYDGVLSIEHEDGLVSIDEGLAKAVEVLQRVLLRELPGEMWWA